ncbi:MAG: archease [Dehalococcoidales bacterium]|nr:archease [Dehalococcoidales bacterium]
MEKDFEVIDHTADIGITAYGNDMKQAFANAACGLFSLITELDTVNGKERREIEVTAPDREALLVNWLNELIYLFETRQMLFNRFELTTLTDTGLKAAGFGESFDASRHHLKREVKATTYHMLKVEQSEGGWRAQVIFDI